ncbi:MAG: adenine phosphoribosyltransferase [Bacteroidota bacterium]
MTLTKRLQSAIVDVPNFPKTGILFKDITPVFADAQLCQDLSVAIAEQFSDIDIVVGLEARGFLLGLLIAQQLKLPFVPIRKAGKLPKATFSESYTLEYGEATLEIHQDAIPKGSNVLIHDDLLATGGTAAAAARLVKKSQANVTGFSFLVELKSLKGRTQLEDFAAIHSLLSL